jgi:hypothetical protein
LTFGLGFVLYLAAGISWFLGFIVLFAAAGALPALAKKMTLLPLASLRDDVEAVIRGDSTNLPKDQAFPELSDLAESINRLIGKDAPEESE